MVVSGYRGGFVFCFRFIFINVDLFWGRKGKEFYRGFGFLDFIDIIGFVSFFLDIF